jgi:hypothetical protein
VEAKDVIADAVLTPEHILLDIAHGLNVPPKKADGLVQRTAGEAVNKDDLIAGPVGITKRVVRAPRAGHIVVIGDGHVLLEVRNPPFEIRAGLTGTVTNLIPNRGAVIETTGAVVQGNWGNGHMDFGLMQSKLDTPEDELVADSIDVSLRGVFILGGHCKDPLVFKKAAEIPLRGLILSSMDSALLPLVKRMTYPILVLEGFGFHALNAMSYNVLTTNDGREISLNAQEYDHHNGIRPEIVIPLDVPEELEDSSPSAMEFAPGHKVRIARAPHLGKIATIESLPAAPVEFSSGIRAPAAEVLLENNKRTVVPLVNLEMII